MEKILENYRTGLSEGLFSIADVARSTDIPFSTLVQMRRPDWQEQTFNRIEEVEKAVAKLADERVDQ